MERKRKGEKGKEKRIEKEDIGVKEGLKGGKGERKKRRERIGEKDRKKDIGVEVGLKGGKQGKKEIENHC